MKMTLRGSLTAASNRALTFCSASPTHLLSRSAALTVKKVASSSPAVALGEHRLARARRAVEQDAAAGLDAEPLGQLRVAERVEHFEANVLLHVVQAGDVVEGQVGAFLQCPGVAVGGFFVVVRTLGRGRGSAGSTARRRGRPRASTLGVGGLAVVGQFQQLRSRLLTGVLKLAAAGLFRQLDHAAGGLQQVGPGRLPLAGPTGVEALLFVTLEAVPGDPRGRGHDAGIVDRGVGAASSPRRRVTRRLSTVKTTSATQISAYAAAWVRLKGSP